MDNIHWQLSVLSKAIHYKNLSGAASHVGVSQPQLSRIISRLEQELGVVLLDRTARRKSGWTPVAYKVADTYFRTSRKLTQSLQQLTTDDTIPHLTVGTLEGLVPLANSFCRQLLENPKLQVIELNVYELSELEEHFEKDELDLAFTCREPGKHKYRHVRNLGYQSLVKAGAKNQLSVFSQFEYANHMQSRAVRTRAPLRSQQKMPQKDSQVLLSNSLSVRRQWIESHGGKGSLPSEVRRKRTSDEDVPVILLGSDLLTPALWQKLELFQV